MDDESVTGAIDFVGKNHLETINAVAQLIAAIGVIGSLFYLGAQIRQNTRSMRAVVVDSLAQSLADLIRPMAQDLALAQSFSVAIEDWHGATDGDRARVAPFLLAAFKLFENAWFQQRERTLGPEQWEGWDAYMRGYYHRPGVKTWWTMRRVTFASGFRQYIEASQPVPDVPSFSDIVSGKV